VSTEFGLPFPIDPQLWSLVDESRAFYARRATRRGPSDWDELRSIRESMAPPVEPDRPPVTELVSADGRSVSVRIHLPADRAATGVLLEIHGGGFYLGSAAGSDVGNRRLVDTLGLAVVSVDYRLAPEDPWPAAPEDCETAASWLAQHAESRFGTTKLALGGFSAGATLAITTLLPLRTRGVTAFAAAVLQFGTYDLAGQTPAGRLIAGEYFLDAYAGSAPDRAHPDLSPIYADLAGLPPVLIVVGSDDILLEDNLAMAARLSAAGVEVDLRIYPEAPHGFTGHSTPMAEAALEHIDTWLTDRLSSTSETVGHRS